MDIAIPRQDDFFPLQFDIRIEVEFVQIHVGQISFGDISFYSKEKKSYSKTQNRQL